MTGGTARIIVLACLVAAGPAACGEEHLTKAQLIARADRICARVERRTEALPPPLEREELSASLRRVQELRAGAMDDLRALEPPPGAADVYDEMLDAMSRVSDHLPELAKATESGDAARVDRVTEEILAVQEHSDSVARAYGFRTCGRLGGTAEPLDEAVNGP